MADFRVTSKGGHLEARWTDSAMIKALNRSERGVRPAATDGLKRAGKRLAEQMRKNLERQGKVDTGALKDSIGYRLEGRRGQQRLIVGPGVEDPSVKPYMMEVEEGRHGNKMPPAGALLPWMQRHGIPEEAEFPIRRKIAEEGYVNQPHPYIDPAADQAGDELDTVVEDVMTAVVSILGG